MLAALPRKPDSDRQEKLALAIRQRPSPRWRLPNWPAYDPNDEYCQNLGDPVRRERFNVDGVKLIVKIQEELRSAP